MWQGKRIVFLDMGHNKIIVCPLVYATLSQNDELFINLISEMEKKYSTITLIMIF